MFGARQLSSFAAQVSRDRFTALACPIVYRGQKVSGLCTGIKTGRKLDEAGFTFSHDAIVRLPIAAAAPNGPQIGEQLTIFLPSSPAGQQVRITEVLPHPNNPEWRIGVTAL
jgi:hypothetical protein